MIFPTRDQPPGIMEPSEESLHFPAVTVAAQGATILGGRISAARSVRRNHLHGVIVQEVPIQLLTVVGAVTDHSLRCFWDESLLQGGFNEFCFMRRSAGDADGDRKTMAVDDRHDLGAFSPASRADSRAPFLAAGCCGGCCVAVRFDRADSEMANRAKVLQCAVSREPVQYRASFLPWPTTPVRSPPRPERFQNRPLGIG